MSYATGQTINEVFLSVDAYNNPVVPATFTSYLLKDGGIYTGVTLNFNLIDSNSGLYEYNFIPMEYGDYQVYISNNEVSLLYISNVFKVEPTPGSTVYVGL
jgi:hypothetical protein